MARRKNGTKRTDQLARLERIIERALPVLVPLLERRTGPNEILVLFSLRHAAKDEGFSTDAIDRLIKHEMEKLAAGTPALAH